MICWNSHLVGGFNPFEKILVKIGIIFPNFRGENKKIFQKTTTKPKPSIALSFFPLLNYHILGAAICQLHNQHSLVARRASDTSHRRNVLMFDFS